MSTISCGIECKDIPNAYQFWLHQRRWDHDVFLDEVHLARRSLATREDSHHRQRQAKLCRNFILLEKNANTIEQYGTIVYIDIKERSSVAQNMHDIRQHHHPVIERLTYL